MITDNPAITHGHLVNQDVRFHHSLCWKAILAGVVTAIGIHLLLLCLGAGIGLASFTPLTDQNPTDNFSMGAAIAWTVCALIALYVGSWIAGCFSAGPKTGSLHGIIVWSATMVITFGLLATGGGLALGGTVKALGTGLGMTGKTVAAGAGDMAKTGAMQGSNQMSSFIDEAMKASPTSAAPNTTVRGKREIGFAVTKLFAPGNDVNSADNQTALVNSLVTYAGMSEADAKKMVDDWMTSYKNLKAEMDQMKQKAEQKAREEADRAASHLAKAATISFFAFLAGLIVSVCGGICGAKKTYRHTTLGISSN